MKCLCATLRHTSRLVTRYYERELQAAGMTPAQFELLATLHAMPDVAQSGLAAKLDVDQTTLSRNLKILTGRRWIQTKASNTDRRQSLYRLSAKGLAAWQASLPHWTRAHQHMQQLLAEQWQPVWSSLDTLMRAGQQIDNQQ